MHSAMDRSFVFRCYGLVPLDGVWVTSDAEEDYTQ